MSSSKSLVQHHRKKKYVYQDRSSPFPIPIASITGEKEKENYWYHFQGVIEGNQVLVNHSGDISYLSSMGFFGRGLMSRGPPTLYSDLPFVHLPTSNSGDIEIIHVMRKHMYLRHKKWRKSLDQHSNKCVNSSSVDSFTSFDEEFDSDVDYHCFENDQSFIQPAVGHSESADIVVSNEQSADLNQGYSSGIQPMEGSNNPVDAKISKATNQRTATDSWEDSSTNQRTATDSWDDSSTNQRTATDSWDDSSTNQRTAIDSWDTMDADEDFWASRDNVLQSKDETSETDRSSVIDCDENVNTCTENFTADNSSPPCKKIRIQGNLEFSSSQNCSSTSLKNLSYQSHEYNSTSGCVQQKTLDYNLSCKDCELAENETDDCVSAEDGKTSTENDNVVLNVTEHSDNSDLVIKNDDDTNKHNITNSKTDEIMPIHPHCYHDDISELDNNHGADFIVIDDSDIDDSTVQVDIKHTSRWLPVRKKEVFQFDEPLVLSIEEAFFLCYGLGCLTVSDEKQTKLTITELWCRFNENKHFLPKYTAYHYFRSKGWVPKQSVLFGTDLLIYKVGPAFYHASYSVIIKTVYDGTLEEVPGYNNRNKKWSDLSGLNRVTEHVAKTLLYCYVIMPKDFSVDEMSSPECISRFKIKLQLVHRWVSSQEREQGQGDEVE